MMSNSFNIMEELDSMGTFSDELPAIDSRIKSEVSPVSADPGKSDKTDKIATVLDNVLERLDGLSKIVQELREEVIDIKKEWSAPAEEVTPSVALAGPGDDLEYETYDQEDEEDEI